MSSPVKHCGCCVIAGACMAAPGTGSLIFINHETHDSGSRIDTEIIYLKIYRETHPIFTKKEQCDNLVIALGCNMNKYELVTF